jgi:hypothetical protein
MLVFQNGLTSNFVCSDFSDIFDVDWFISYLSKDVTIVKRIPYEVMMSMDKLPWTMRAPRKSMPEFYIDEVLPILMRRRVSNLPILCHGLETYVAYCFDSITVHTSCFFFLVCCLPVFVVIYHVLRKHASYMILVINLFHFKCRV